MPAAPDLLDLDALPSLRGAAGDAFDRLGPRGLPYAEYFRFLSQFEASASALRAIPLATGPRFTLD